MIDSHCHLNATDYDEPVQDILKTAGQVGVKKCLAIACDVNDFDELKNQLKQFPELFGAVGIHPEYADKPFDIDVLRQFIRKTPRIIGVGECGLDYHEMGKNTKLKQETLFKEQIDLAHELGLPLIIHSRDAEGDMRTILKAAYKDGKLKNGFVLHCFSGSIDMAKETVKMGGYLSASGVITFKNATKLREVFSTIPLDRLLVETDAPYLAPEPYRGKKNQPAFVVRTLDKLAEVKGMTVDEMDCITTQNFNRLFLGEKA
ncbi:MAG: TatD family hydrolase [Alphaproteobacteria bacterium]|nr:TatD family hydrolase [Alphaproteobacteria bacterium]